jgi:PAS domain S-box-containing protein
MKNNATELTVVRKKGKNRPQNVPVRKENSVSMENDGFFRMMSENSSDIIFRGHYLPTFGFDFVSQSSTHIMGYAPEEFYADPHLAEKCVPPEDLRLLKDLTPSSTPSGIEPVVLRWKRKDGRVIWTEHFLTINRNERGEEETFLMIVRDITERKMAEEALQIEKNKLQSVIDAMSDDLTIQDRDYNIIFQNEPSQATSGGDHIGEKCYRVYENRENICDGCPIALAFKDGKPHTMERKRTTPSGVTTYWEVTANPVRNSVGNVTSCLEISRDITERKEAEKALQESQQFISSLLENAPHATIVLNPDTSVKYVNPAWERLNGWSLAEVIGFKAPYPWWTEEFKTEEVLSSFKEAIRQPGGSAELIAVKRNGEHYWISINWDPVTRDGEFQYVIINSVDINGRNTAEEKRQAILKTALDGFWICDLEGKFLEVNDSYCQMTGYTREELLKMSIQDIEAVEDPGQTIQHIKKIIAQGSDRFETHHKRRDGSIIDIEISVKYHNNGEGQLIVFVRDITERKRMEKALRESEEKFSAAFQASPHMIIITDFNDGTYLEVNESFINNTGYSREELIGHNPDEFGLWANPDDTGKMIKLIEEQGKVTGEEYDFRMKSGEIRTWLCSVEIISIGGNKCSLGVATDITERKKAREAVKESEEKFSKAFQASPGSISISRFSDGKFIEVNDSFLRDKGFTREEVIGRSSHNFNIWANQDDRVRIIKTLKEGGKVRNEVLQYRTKSGFIRTGLVSAEIINIGNEPCMLVLNNDITQQKQAEEQLRLLSSVTQQVSDATIVTDAKLKITYMNRAAENLLGCSIDEVRGQSLNIFDNTFPTEETAREVRRTVKSGQIWYQTVTKRRKDGSTFICDCRLSPLYDERGQICSYIDVQRDVTEQKEVEAKLHAQKQLIESILANMPGGVLVIDKNDRIILANESVHKIFHRRRNAMINKPLREAIPHNQLFKLYTGVKLGRNENGTLEFRHRVQGYDKIITCSAIKMDGDLTLLTFIDVSREREEEEKLYLTDRLASIGEMAAGLAHELNNPLTGILSLSQLLIDSDIPPESREDLICINSEARRAAGIVKNVLLFTRNNNYENGQSSANEVVKNVLRLREYEEMAHNIQVVTRFQEDLGEIQIDKYQLQQVFLNIILNAEAAIKETGRPGRLTITTKKTNNHVNITFTDNGCGIKKHVLPRIFDPFFTTKDIGKGTGLGLSICYGIVAKHGGKINVNTRLHKGTTFAVKIPAVNLDKAVSN